MALLVRSRALARAPLAGSVRYSSGWAEKAKGLPSAFPSTTMEAPNMFSSDKMTLDVPGRQNPVYPSPWNKWFPYEPVPSTPKIGPYYVHCSASEDYYFCTCGESNAQPFCESPGDRCAKQPLFVPKFYKPRYDGKKLLCGCKKAPGEMCTGACVLMWADVHPFMFSMYMYGSCFVFGILSAWMFHP